MVCRWVCADMKKKNDEASLDTFLISFFNAKHRIVKVHSHQN